MASGARALPRSVSYLQTVLSIELVAEAERRGAGAAVQRGRLLLQAR